MQNISHQILKYKKNQPERVVRAFGKDPDSESAPRPINQYNLEQF